MRVSGILIAAGLLTALAYPHAQAPLTSGLDLTSIDRSIRPQDDLFRYMNGGWRARTPVPPERVSYGLFTELAERAEVDLRTLIEDVAAGRVTRRVSATTQQIADLYASMMNEALIESMGVKPIQPQLDKIAAIKTPKELAAEIGYLSSIAAGGPFAGTVGLDPRDPTQFVVQLSQGGTLLPDRDYYLKDDPAFVDARAKYEDYLTLIFTLTSRPNAAADARAVLALETALAKIQWTQADSRDLTKTANTFPLWRLPEEMPGFDWIAWARPQSLDRAGQLLLSQPSFFRGFAALVPNVPLDTWKAWLAARYITAMSPNVSTAVSNARFEFFGRILTGQEIPRLRWKRGVSLVSAILGDAIGRLYVERHFSPTARSRAQKLADNLTEAYRRALAESDWLKPATRTEALRKLSTLSIKIGYPDDWRSYRGLVIKPDDLVGNIHRARLFDNAYRMSRLARPADRREWLVAPQTVNAYYNHALNEIVLPAAILQPPLFDADADDAVNYGGIGAVVGHEIGHAFDDRGRYLDWSGVPRNWWRPEDQVEYERRAARLVDQFNALPGADGLRVNGQLTLAENFGDLGGLSIAHRAYQLALGGRPAPVIDGFTGDQRFFLGWAQAWRFVIRPEYVRQWLLSSPHALPEYRANTPVSNLDAFYAAFDVKPGDKLYRESTDRIKIW
jgi:putative endopeptidase